MLLYNLIALILRENCVKCQAAKIVKEIKFKGVWGKLEAKKLFPDTNIHKMSKTDSGFHVK